MCRRRSTVQPEYKLPGVASQGVQSMLSAELCGWDGTKDKRQVRSKEKAFYIGGGAARTGKCRLIAGSWRELPLSSIRKLQVCNFTNPVHISPTTSESSNPSQWLPRERLLAVRRRTSSSALRPERVSNKKRKNAPDAQRQEERDLC